MSKDPDLRDIIKVRRCGEKVVEMHRWEEYQSVDFTSVAEWEVRWQAKLAAAEATSSASTSSLPMTTPLPRRIPQEIGDWALDEWRYDGDLVLAHTLQLPFVAKRIVGVVYAGHVPGVRQLWKQVPTAESRQRYDAALLKQPADCPGPTARQTICLAAGSVAALALAGSHPAVRYNAAGKVLRRTAGVAAAAGSAATLTAAGVVVLLTRLTTRLEKAAVRAEEEGLVQPRVKQLRGCVKDPKEGARSGLDAVEVKVVNGVGKYKTGRFVDIQWR